MEWTDLLRELTRTLGHLKAQGVRYVNVAPDAEFAALQGVPTAAAPSPTSPSPSQRYASRMEQPAAAAPVIAEPPPAPELPTKSPDEIGTLESLYMQYRGCQACRLGSTRNRFVFGTGSERPRIMFIGEGPGAEEDQQGLPFVGRAGQLLTGFIQAMGLVREDVYITNVVKCRPPGNRNPEPDEVASCRPILKRQIELLNPTLIVTLGNVPLKSLNPQAAGITKERGRMFQYDRWQVFPTFHPSFLLRSPDMIGECWADLRRAFAIAYPETSGESGGAPA